jgi:hypothetical protein
MKLVNPLQAAVRIGEEIRREEEAQGRRVLGNNSSLKIDSIQIIELRYKAEVRKGLGQGSKYLSTECRADETNQDRTE